MFSKIFQFTCFYSTQSRDATIENSQIKNISTSGYHRTRQECARMNLLREIITGGGVTLPLHPSISLGALLLNTRYNKKINQADVLPSSDSINTNEDFLPGQLHCYSFFCDASLFDLNFSAELSSNTFKQTAQQLVLSHRNTNHEVVIKWWMIPRKYFSPFGQSFASNAAFPHAKNGVYLAAAGTPVTDLQIGTYWLFERDLWRTYLNPLPLSQKEFAMQIQYLPGQSVRILCHYDSKENQHFTSDHLQCYTEQVNRCRLQIEKSFSPFLKLRSRLEKVWLRNSPNIQGINLYHDLEYKLNSDFSLLFRFSSFSVDTYSVHTYEYENDLPGAFGSYSVYEKGTKWYVLVKWHITAKYILWFKYRHLFLDGVKSIGSGNDLIVGDQKQELRLQLNWEY